jgi:hypothetical protein
MNLRFKWINWNTHRQTVSGERLTPRNTETAGLKERRADLAECLTPPQGDLRKPTHTRRPKVCAQSGHGARAAAHNAAERGRAGVGADREVAR